MHSGGDGVDGPLPLVHKVVSGDKREGSGSDLVEHLVPESMREWAASEEMRHRLLLLVEKHTLGCVLQAVSRKTLPSLTPDLASKPDEEIQPWRCPRFPV